MEVKSQPLEINLLGINSDTITCLYDLEQIILPVCALVSSSKLWITIEVLIGLL